MIIIWHSFKPPHPHKWSWGYIGITLSIRSSVCLWNRVRSTSFLWWNRGSSYFTQSLLMTWRFVMILTKGHSGKFKATENKSAIFLSGPYLSFGETLEAHTKDKYYACPVGVSRIQPKIVWAISLEVHRKEKYKINVRFISFSWRNIRSSLLTYRSLMT